RAWRAEVVAVHVRWRKSSGRELRRAPGAKRGRGGLGDERTPDVDGNAAAGAGPPGDQRHTGPAPPLTRPRGRTVDANSRVARRRACSLSWRASRSVQFAVAPRPPGHGTWRRGTAAASSAWPAV